MRLSFLTFVLFLFFPSSFFFSPSSPSKLTLLAAPSSPTSLSPRPFFHLLPSFSPSPFSQVDEVWGTKKDKEEKKRKKEEQASYDPRAARDIRKQDKKKDDVEVEGQGLLLFEEEEVNDEQKPQFAGHVVAVLERAPGQLFSGTLGVLRPSSAATQQKQDAERREREGVDLKTGGGGGGAGGGQGGGSNGHHQQAPKIIWFRPTDKRVPLIAIRSSPFPSLPSSLLLRTDPLPPPSHSQRPNKPPRTSSTVPTPIKTVSSSPASNVGPSLPSIPSVNSSKNSDPSGTSRSRRTRC